MAELARGSVSDRPWGRTLGALGMRGLTGQLTLIGDGDGKPYRIAFAEGAIVGAHSPLGSDSAVRMALTGNLITSTQVNDITRRMAAAPDRDEVELLAEIARLVPEQAHRLRRRLVAQRAARTFSIDQGNFVVEDQVTISALPGSELDIRAIIYMGARSNLSEDRLTADLAQLGVWFQLKQAAIEDLPQYGFTEAEKPVLEMLLEGANLADIEATHANLGQRAIRAVTYALASCAALEQRATREPSTIGEQPPSTAPTQPRTPMPAPTTTLGRGTPPPGSTLPSAPTWQSQPPLRAKSSTVQPALRTKTPTTPPGTENVVRMKSPTGQPPMSTAPLPQQRPPGAPSAPQQRPPGAPSAPQPRRAKRNTAATNEIEQLLAMKGPLLDRGVDHFTLLGLPQHASGDEIRTTYFMLARKLHPDRLAAIGVVDENKIALRLMAQINAAFAVLNDPAKRDEYVSVLARGGEAAVAAEASRVDEVAMRVMRAEECFKQGEMALRRDQIAAALTAFTAAVALQPNEPEYQALLAWAQFAAAPDKNAVSMATRRALTKAAEANDRNPTPRFYLGRVERMLGREREALEHFQTVLRIKPGHAEASSEARILEQRLKGKR